MLVETWSNDLLNLEHDGFECFALHRKRSKGAKRDSGGILIYVRKHLVSENIMYTCVDDNIIWLRLEAQRIGLNDDVFLCLCYNPPQGSSREGLNDDISCFGKIYDTMIEIENTVESHCNFLVCGDFNARCATLPDYVEFDNNNGFDVLPDDYVADDSLPSRVSEDPIINQYGRSLIDMCRQTGLRIMNGRTGKDRAHGKCTFVGHNGKSVVDYVLASENMIPLIDKFVVYEPNILSDHCLISFTSELTQNEEITRLADTCRLNSNTCDSQASKVTFKYCFNEERSDIFTETINSNTFKDEIEILKNNIMSATVIDDIDTNLDEFNKLLQSACDPAFKRNIFHKINSDTGIENSTEHQNDNSNKQPWFDEACEEMRNSFYHHLNKYRADSSDINRQEMVTARSEYKKVLRTCRNKYNKSKTTELIAAKSQNAKLYWKMLKDITVRNKSKTLTAKTFELYFKSVNDPQSNFYQPDEDVIFFNERYLNGEMQVMFDELNIPVSRLEITKSILQLKNGKSAGPDYFINEIFKNSNDTILSYICELFNSILDAGHFPSCWSEGYIIPLHKKGNMENVENYRGITLLSTLGKLFTRILNNRLNEWAEKYNVYVEAQAGFRQNMGTIDNIFTLHSIIAYYLNSGRKLFVSFVDFTKAFDYVVRENLWQKMIKFGIRGKILQVIKSMYTSVKSKVKYENTLSEEFTCALGVRQGECLSPFLFAMYLNDLENEFSMKGASGIDLDMLKIFLLMYADDIVILAESAEGLQKGLNILQEYCLKWKLTVNTLKTKCLIFRKGRLPQREIIFYYNENELEIVKHFQFLGVVFSTGGSFTEAQTTLSGQAQKAIFKLNKYLHNFVNIPVKHYLELFDKLVLPILCYGCEVWGFCKADKIEKVHLQFCKRLLKVKTSTPNDMIYGELGRHPLQINRYCRIIKYWLKVLNSNDNKYIKNTYNMVLQYNENNPQKVNWVSLVKNLLSELGFYEVWINQGVGNVNAFVSLFKQRICDNYKQDWNARISQSPKARFYCLFSNFGFKSYLNLDTAKNIRIYISKLRLSSHTLEIEKGRYKKPNPVPVNERKCKECNTLEDEFHFLLECKKYQDLRAMYIKRYYWVRPNVPKLITLLTSENVNECRKLGKFIKKAFEIKNSN